MIAPETGAELQATAFAAITLRRMFRVMAALFIAITPLLWVRYGAGMALSFVLGGAISLVNFFWLKQTLIVMVEAIAVGGKKRSAGGIVLRFVLRYVLIGVAAYAIFKSSAMSLYGLCAGLSLPVGAVLIEAAYAIYGALRRGI
ncbi:MAG TPA: ATP synthase subunit I [Candidatus Angelobacter sp.]|nr:ATP synthase subunit I [Candidatus Angelobacter sp.]